MLFQICFVLSPNETVVLFLRLKLLVLDRFLYKMFLYYCDVSVKQKYICLYKYNIFSLIYKTLAKAQNISFDKICEIEYNI